MKAFKVCYVSTEVAPFANSGGLADASRLLPVALKEMDQDIRLMMPKYKLINERKYVLREVIRLREVSIDLTGEAKLANAKTAFLPNSKVHVYFLSVPDYFDRKGIYADPQSEVSYSDNAERFAYFSKGVLETLKLLHWQPDIIHCCDWPTALIPFYLKTHYVNDNFFEHTRTLLTIHNLASQGIFSLETGKAIGIAYQYLQEGKEFEHDGQLNLLKGGLHFADLLNTTSDQYSKAIFSNPELAYGLGDILEQRKKDLYGIMNGADYEKWSPETDKNIPVQYDAKSLEDKSFSKAELREHLKWQTDASLPLIAMMTEVLDQGGLSLLMELLEDIIKLNAQLVIMGNRLKPDQVKRFQKFAQKNSSKVALLERFDNRLAHLMLAGADMLFLPCELDTGYSLHLQGLRYGTVPIVREVGGFADSINQFNPESGKGNGFTFEKFDKAYLLKTLKHALNLWEDKKAWSKLQKNGMREDFSWNVIAQKYIKLYEKAIKKK